MGKNDNIAIVETVGGQLAFADAIDVNLERIREAKAEYH